MLHGYLIMKLFRDAVLRLAPRCALLFLCIAAFSQPAASRTGQDQPSPAQFRVVRVLCGSKGELHGNEYIMQEPKTVFHVPDDHQIVISFEWQGPPGSHHAVGNWRSPDGKIALTSDFDLNAQGTRYIGTWTLAIPASITPGLWALEVEVDGKSAGTQTFQIVSTQTPPAPTTPPPPSAAQVYQRAASATAFITSLDENGGPITRGLGFLIDKGLVLTAFQAIDGASSLRLEFADGSRIAVADVLAWNREQDWALLAVPSEKEQPLTRAAPDSWKVGDLCYLITSQGQGSRTIQTVNITGFQATRLTGQRLEISSPGAEGWLGAPLLDISGNLIGVLSGGLAGLGSRRMGSWANYMDPGGSGATMNPTVLPLSAIPSRPASQQPVAFSALAARGVLTVPLVLNPQAATGTLCDGFQQFNGQAIVPTHPANEFSRKQGTFGVVITWGPSEKIKSTAQLRIFDADNNAIVQTRPTNIKLQPRVTMYSAWKIPLGSLRPGIYRIDLLLGDKPEWRSFFRLVD